MPLTHSLSMREMPSGILPVLGSLNLLNSHSALFGPPSCSTKGGLGRLLLPLPPAIGGVPNSERSQTEPTSVRKITAAGMVFMLWV
jgi:hypothetical protein